MKIRPLGKLIIFILVVCAAYGGYRLYGKFTGASAGTGHGATVSGDQGVLGRPLVVGLNEWPGFAGGLFANNGLTPNHDCIFYKKGNLLVEFRLRNDPVAMLQEYTRGDIDVIWSTIDSAVTQLGGLEKNGAATKVFMQCDWSRGGDAILAMPGINRIEDLAGKKVALITLSPSEYLLQFGLQNSSLSESEQKGVIHKMVEMDDPDKLQKALATGAVPAIVTWEPNISATLAKVSGSKVILSTETAANAIADVFMARDEFISKHPEAIKAFIEGWFGGTIEANRSPQKAVEVVMDNMPTFKALGPDKTADTFAKVKLADMSDNAKTFGLAGDPPLYDTIYAEAMKMYLGRGVLDTKVSAADSKAVEQLKTVFAAQRPEDRTVAPKEEFTFSEKQQKRAASQTPVMTKPVNIYFASGSAGLDDNAKSILRTAVGDMLKVSSNAFIRVEGNTDSVGNAAMNVALSRRRAQAVVSFLVASGFARERFIVKGNGPHKPVADNSTDDGRRKNRRTDIQVLKK